MGRVGRRKGWRVVMRPSLVHDQNFEADPSVCKNIELGGRADENQAQVPYHRQHI